MKKETQSVSVRIAAPELHTALFEIQGTAPLVVHRFSAKTQQGMLDKMVAGSVARKGKQREPLDPEAKYNEARYVSPEGWDGFNASSIRNGMISACRLVNFKMTLAKLSLFVVADGRDAKEPQYQLVRIYGKPRRLESMARVETGQAYVTIRPCYDEWKAKLRIRFDSEQFSVKDVANLLSRVGAQVGICEGRPDSKNSAGMGWGTFEIVNQKSE
jgi:hypothetical protein